MHEGRHRRIVIGGAGVNTHWDWWSFFLDGRRGSIWLARHGAFVLLACPGTNNWGRILLPPPEAGPRRGVSSSRAALTAYPTGKVKQVEQTLGCRVGIDGHVSGGRGFAMLEVVAPVALGFGGGWEGEHEEKGDDDRRYIESSHC